MRGNLPTRILRVRERELDGTVLALAGLARLGVGGLEAGGEVEFVVPASWGEDVGGERVWISPIAPETCLPAVGQGALCIEARCGDETVGAFLARLDDADSRAEVACERAVMRALEGGCQVPIAAWAQAAGDTIRVQAAVASLDGQRKVFAEGTGLARAAADVGAGTAVRLLALGAEEILSAIRTSA